METPALHEHRKSQQPLLESASPAFYTLVYERTERDRVLQNDRREINVLLTTAIIPFQLRSFLCSCPLRVDFH
jgi:hypothetical protein